MTWNAGAGEHEEDYMFIDFVSYDDGQTGLILDGQLYQKRTEDPGTEALLNQELVLDSDATDSSGIDDNGFTITFADTSLLYLFVDALIDYENSTISALNQAGAVWVTSDDTVYGNADDVDVVSSMADIIVTD
jgi:hypothetical protein